MDFARLLAIEPISKGSAITYTYNSHLGICHKETVLCIG